MCYLLGGIFTAAVAIPKTAGIAIEHTRSVLGVTIEIATSVKGSDSALEANHQTEGVQVRRSQ